MVSDGPSKYRAEKWHPVVKLGSYCTEFIEVLKESQPQLLEQLDILSDFNGYYQGLLVYLKSPAKREGIDLEIMAIESTRSTSVDFAGVRVEFSSQSEALELARAILNDEVLHVASYQSNRFISGQLAGHAEAEKLLQENEYVSRGCMDYLLPAKFKRISVHSWSGKLDRSSKGW
ncbi:hypothetical protein KDL29_05805 [bacterium]|nr:hypothetical protein [bacterium]